MNYVVLLLPLTGLGVEVRGPYRSFKRAEADAKAWDGIDGCSASVEPLLTQDGWPKPSYGRHIAALQQGKP